MSNNISEVFGSEVFNDHVMKEMLDPEVYEELHATIEAGNPLDVKLQIRLRQPCAIGR